MIITTNFCRPIFKISKGSGSKLKINPSYVNYSGKPVSVNGCPSKKLYAIFDRSTILKLQVRGKGNKNNLGHYSAFMQFYRTSSPLH